MYIRTDCGGAYRRTQDVWTPITDWLTFEHRSDYGIESIATNPNDGSEVYIACGSYLPDDGRDAGTIYKSTDYGAHWTQAYFHDAPVKRFDGTTGIAMNGNGDRRWGGERLACDPGSKGHLLFGSRVQGLWRSSDDAKTWTRVASVPAGTVGYGVTAVAYDPRANGVVYAAVEGVGVYRSSDHGGSWKLIAAQPSWPATVRRMSVSADGSVWMTYGATTSPDNPGGDSSVRGGIAEYVPASNTYKLSNPVPGGASYFIALAVNPDDPKDIAAAASTSAKSEAGSSTFWHTRDEGKTWTQVSASQHSTLPWYQTSTYTVSAFLYDPHGDFGTPGSLWYTDGTGIWHSHGPISEAGTEFTSEERGHEEFCVSSLSTPPSGPNELIAGVMDQGGFAWGAKDVAAYPSHRLTSNIKGPWSALTLALAYEENNPLNIAAIYAQADFGGPYYLALSSDGGNNWQAVGSEGEHGWVDSLPQQVTVGGQRTDFAPVSLAMSATNPDNIVVLGNCRVNGASSLVSVYTTQGLKTKEWHLSDGLFRAGSGAGECNDILVSEPVQGNVFYAVNGDYVYKSADSGKTFTRLSSPTDAQAWGTQKLQATPGRSGDLWYSAEADKGSWQNHRDPLPAWEGLYHSTDGGQSWSKLPNVTRCVTFSLGAKALYYYGRNSRGATANADTVYCSTDGGATWANILDPDGPNKIGCYPLWMQASRQTDGRVFIGTSGRGVFYSTPTK